MNPETEDAVMRIVHILRFVWDMRVSAEVILAYGNDKSADTPFPSVASYLIAVYYNLSANNQRELTEIRKWIAAHEKITNG